MSISKVRIENTKGHSFTLKVTEAVTGEEIHVSRLEILWEPSIKAYVARIDIPAPILDLVVPVEVNDGR